MNFEWTPTNTVSCLQYGSVKKVFRMRWKILIIKMNYKWMICASTGQTMHIVGIHKDQFYHKYNLLLWRAINALNVTPQPAHYLRRLAFPRQPFVDTLCSIIHTCVVLRLNQTVDRTPCSSTLNSVKTLCFPQKHDAPILKFREDWQRS